MRETQAKEEVGLALIELYDVLESEAREFAAELETLIEIKLVYKAFLKSKMAVVYAPKSYRLAHELLETQFPNLRKLPFCYNVVPLCYNIMTISCPSCDEEIFHRFRGLKEDNIVLPLGECDKNTVTSIPSTILCPHCGEAAVIDIGILVNVRKGLKYDRS